MENRFRTFGCATLLLFSAAFAVEGCHAQKPSSSTVSPALARRIEIMIRSKANLPAAYDVRVTDRKPSKINGYDDVTIAFATDGQPPRSMTFLLSNDEKTLAQFNTFDISKDPKTLVSDVGRPARNGVEKAPVTIVVFDDLQCPFCARMHTQLFPAITNRYGNKVRVIYKDFPLSQHPWAMRAAVDTSCLAAQNGAGYWESVDYIHAHAGEISVQADTPEKSLAQSKQKLDKVVHDEGVRQKVDAVKLDACIAKQDESSVQASIHEAEVLGVDATPILFINGEKINGLVPVEFLDREIDRALVIEGVTPPPPAAPTTTAPSTAGGN